VRTDGPHAEAQEDHDNPRWYAGARERLVALDQAVSSKRRGSQNWRKACARRGAFKAKLARKRHEHQHQLSASLAARCIVFASEKLSVKNMTASAAGTVHAPGKNVAAKKGLNREILDTAPAALLQKIAYKVSETGALYLEAPTRSLKPSQTCPACGAVQKKSLQQRWHLCQVCSHAEDRDSAAARVVLRWALGTWHCGQELAEAV
jgi:putative transposase